MLYVWQFKFISVFQTPFLCFKFLVPKMYGQIRQLSLDLVILFNCLDGLAYPGGGSFALIKYSWIFFGL